MIHYSFSKDDLWDLINSDVPNWERRSVRRANKVIKAGHYNEKTSIWSEVKSVYMTLQKNKCAFCERQFESPDTGKIEFDLEHFRPKSSVKLWPDPLIHPKLSYSLPTGAASTAGYYWLCYDPFNYAASCKICNTIFKSDYFPVQGARGAAPTSSEDLQDENPYLCFPLGEYGEDPERLVTFKATVAVPTFEESADPFNHQRGQVIIDLFGLNDREQLHRERARTIAIFGPSFDAREKGTAGPDDLEIIRRASLPDIPHASCLRAFSHLWSVDPVLARETLTKCQMYATASITKNSP